MVPHAANKAIEPTKSHHWLKPKCLQNITITRFASDRGIITFHANSMSWSKRKRGIVQRSMIIMHRKKKAFPDRISNLTSHKPG